MGRRFTLDVLDIVAAIIAGYVIFAPISSPIKVSIFVLAVLVYALAKWNGRIL